MLRSLVGSEMCIRDRGLLLRMWLGVRPTAASPNETTPKTYQGWMCKTGFFSGFQDQKQKSLADSDFVCDSKVRTIAPDKKTLQYTASTNNRCTRYHRYQIGEGVACSESLHIGELRGRGRLVSCTSSVLKASSRSGKNITKNVHATFYIRYQQK